MEELVTLQNKNLNTPRQFPWETPPFVGPPSPAQKLLHNSTIGYLSESTKNAARNNKFYNVGKVGQSFRSSLAEYSTGLSNRIYRNTGTNTGTPTLKTINNYKPIYQNGKVIKGSTSTSLATRGAVGLAITKYGSGGGGGEFSK